jgi:hypothetical protein
MVMFEERSLHERQYSSNVIREALAWSSILLLNYLH